MGARLADAVPDQDGIGDAEADMDAAQDTDSEREGGGLVQVVRVVAMMGAGGDDSVERVVLALDVVELVDVALADWRHDGKFEIDAADLGGENVAAGMKRVQPDCSAPTAARRRAAGPGAPEVQATRLAAGRRV